MPTTQNANQLTMLVNAVQHRPMCMSILGPRRSRAALEAVVLPAVLISMPSSLGPVRHRTSHRRAAGRALSRAVAPGTRLKNLRPSFLARNLWGFHYCSAYYGWHNMADVQSLYIAWPGLVEVRHCIDEQSKLENISVQGVRCWVRRVFSQVVCCFPSSYRLTQALRLSLRICQ